MTARSPARLGSMPTQPSSGGRPVSPEVSLTSRLTKAMLVPAANSAVATQRAHGFLVLAAQMAQSRLRTPSAPRTGR